VHSGLDDRGVLYVADDDEGAVLTNGNGHTGANERQRPFFSQSRKGRKEDLDRLLNSRFKT
jgi:hypothetical protein